MVSWWQNGSSGFTGKAEPCSSPAMARLLSAAAVKSSANMAQSVYAIISHLWFLTTKSCDQREPELVPETLGLARKMEQGE